MKTAATFLLTLLLAAHGSFAYELYYKSGSVKGTVLDQSGKPLEFVNVMLIRATDSTLVKGTITDTKGFFEVESVTEGNYRMMFSQLGYQKLYSSVFTAIPGEVKDLGSVEMKEDVKLLDLVEVVARKPLIERHTDKVVMNVENSIVDAGGTAMEVLQRSPGVTVDNEDNISLKGKSGVVILIDGRQSRLESGDLGEMLKSMSSDQIEKIEIMSNPPARFEASGNSGVINIVTRKDQRFGTNGSVRGTFGQGKRPDASTGINLNFRQGKTNVYGSYGYDWRKSIEDVRITRNFRQEDVISSVFRQGSDIEFIGKTHHLKAGADFYLNKKNTFGLILTGMFNNHVTEGANTTQIESGNGTALGKAVTYNDSDIGWEDFNTNFNWLHQFDTTGRKVSVDFDYGSFSRDGNQKFISYGDDYTTGHQTMDILKSTSPSTLSIYSGKIDFEIPFNKDTRLETGIKSSFVTTDNNVRYYNVEDGFDIPDTTRSNRFRYRENINAIYGSLKTSYKEFGIQVGLRAEHTNAVGEQVTLDSTFRMEYVKLFPTLYIQKNLSKNHDLNFAFSRRYDRPSYQSLNPFRFFLDQYTFEQGNPLLKPQSSYNFELTHTYKSLYSVTVSYSYTDQVMTRVTKQIDSVYTTYATTENLESLVNYGISFSLPVAFFKWWNSNHFINAYRNSYSGEFEGGQLNSDSYLLMVNSVNTFTLPRGYSLELRAWYQSPHEFGIFKVNDMSSVSLGLEKKFNKDQTSVKVLVNDIFYQSTFSGTTRYQNQDLKISSFDDTRFVRLFVSHRFGKKTVQQARRRTTASDEERNRINRNK